MIYKKLIISILFVFSALLKLYDYSATVTYFQSLIHLPVLFVKIGLGFFIMLEFILAFILVNFHLLIVVDILMFLLVCFCFLNIYMIVQHYDNCGCFGTVVKMNPIVTLVKNAGLIVLLYNIKRKESRAYVH